jgi:hypothetical protein
MDDENTRNLLRQLAADLHNKLKAMGHVDAIVVLHNDVTSNRLNPATYTILQMIDQKFAMAEQSVWENTVVAYSKCNAHETTWRSGLKAKKSQLQQQIRKKVPNCAVDVPVVALGGGRFRPSRTERRSRSRSRSPRSRPSSLESSEADMMRPDCRDEDGFEALWHFIKNTKPLDTSLLQPFEGPDQKWEKIVEARDAAEARAKAALIYVSVITKLATLFAVLFWRAFFLPGWLARWVFLNFNGPVDEVVFLILLACWVGPSDVWYSCAHLWQVWLWPHMQPLLMSSAASVQCTLRGHIQ